jgi:hypothetical protein
MNQKKYATKINSKMKINRLIISAILFSKILSNFQALLILAKKGMITQTQIMLRCIFEPLFALSAISKANKYHIRLINSDECERLKALKKLKKYHERNNPEDPLISQIELVVKKITKRIKDKK